MREHPIIFSAPMVRAILAGHKTQTRRVVKPQPSAGVRQSPFVRSGIEDGHGRELRSPYGRPGDRLWVRETLACTAHHGVWYAADADGFNNLIKDRRASDLCERYGHPYFDIEERHIPSIHMPRWASRITLEITDVRVERVQTMEGQAPYPGECDALAEGVHRIHHGDGAYYYSAFRNESHPQNWVDPTDAFRELWDSINAKRGHGWDTNPWVWALTFKRVDGDD